MSFTALSDSCERNATVESLFCSENLHAESDKNLHPVQVDSWDEDDRQGFSSRTRKRSYPFPGEFGHSHPILQPTPKSTGIQLNDVNSLKKVKTEELQDNENTCFYEREEKLQRILDLLLSNTTTEVVYQAEMLRTPTSNESSSYEDYNYWEKETMRFVSRTSKLGKTNLYSKDYDYIERLQEGSVTATAREQIVLWLLDLREPLQLNTSTVYLAVSCFDRFLTRQKISKQYLRAVAASSLWIATKFNEIEPLSAKTLEWLSQVDYSCLQTCELLQLSVLDWQVHDLTPHSYFSFLRSMAFRQESSSNFRTDSLECSEEEMQQCSLLVEIFLDLCSIRYELLRFSRLTIVLACILSACSLLDTKQNRPDETEKRLHRIRKQLGIDTSDISQCMREVFAYFEHNFQFHQRQQSLFYHKDETGQVSNDATLLYRREDSHTPTSITEISFSSSLQ